MLVDGDLDAAAESLLDAISIFRSEEDHLGLILAVSRLGELAWRRGDIALFAEMHAELLELGRAGRSRGVTTGATARLGLARLLQGDVGDAQLLARAALGSTGESFMPVVNGYAFKTAGLVNLRLGHIDEGPRSASRRDRSVRARNRHRRRRSGRAVLGRPLALVRRDGGSRRSPPSRRERSRASPRSWRPLDSGAGRSQPRSCQLPR